nr:unnamed protein product [Digitaria exilis]
MTGALARALGRHDADGGEEDDGDGGGEPGDEEHQRLGVAAAAIDGEVELCEDGATDADPKQRAAAALREVLDGGDEGGGAGERLRVGTGADVEAHEPERWTCDVAGEGEVHHEVAGEVHGGAGSEDDGGRGDLE